MDLKYDQEVKQTSNIKLIVSSGKCKMQLGNPRRFYEFIERLSVCCTFISFYFSSNLRIQFLVEQLLHTSIQQLWDMRFN